MEEITAYQIDGLAEVLEQNWTIKFMGSTDEATRRCRLAHSALKLSRSQWLQIWVCGPTGHWIQCHVSPDKNALRRATEISTKKFVDILARHVDESEFGPIFGMKPEGGIFINWIPLVLVVPQQNGSVQLQWSENMLTHCRLDKLALTAELDAGLSATEGGAGLRARLSQTRWSP